MTTIQIDEKDPTLLAVSFPDDPIGNDLIREIPGRRWSYRSDGPNPPMLDRAQHARSRCSDRQTVR